MKRPTRRDRCYLAGLRAARLTPAQAARAWGHLSTALIGTLAEADIPKFNDLFQAIRSATIHGKHDVHDHSRRTQNRPAND